MVLPLVQRELLVKSRRWRAQGMRCVAATGLIVLVALPLMTMHPLSRGGRLPFLVMSTFCLVLALFGGAIWTADQISWEKRNRTLSLLWLTRVRVIDVLLGKVSGAALDAVYCLIGLIPVLAIPLTLGGVTAWEIGAMSTLLLCSLVYSLSAGLLASTLSFWQTTSYLFALSLISVVALAGWMAIGGILLKMWTEPPRGTSRNQIGKYEHGGLVAVTVAAFALFAFHVHLVSVAGYYFAIGFLVPSPGFAAYAVFAMSAAKGAPLLAASCVTMLLLALVWGHVSYFVLRRNWRATDQGWAEAQRMAEKSSKDAVSRIPIKRRGAAKREERPLWRLGSDSVSPYRGTLWLAGAIFLGRWLWLGSGGIGSDWSILIFFLTGPLVTLLIGFLIARSACEFFAEAASHRFLEPLLTTPVDRKGLLAEQWHRLLKTIGIPAAQVIIGFGVLLVLKEGMSESPDWNRLGLVAGSVTIGLSHFVALGWAGIAFGLTAKSVPKATWMAFGLVLLPEVPVWLFSGTLGPNLLVYGVLLVKDLGLAFWMRKRAQLELGLSNGVEDWPVGKMSEGSSIGQR